MAQFKSIKSAKDTGLDGIEFIKTDSQITEVVVGGKLRIKRGESYNQNLIVLIEQPFEEAKRFKMTAKIDGFDPKISYHEGRYEAETAAHELEGKGADATVEEVTVLVDEDGEFAGEVGEATAVEREDVPAF